MNPHDRTKSWASLVLPYSEGSLWWKYHLSFLVRIHGCSCLHCLVYFGMTQVLGFPTFLLGTIPAVNTVRNFFFYSTFILILQNFIVPFFVRSSRTTLQSFVPTFVFVLFIQPEPRAVWTMLPNLHLREVIPFSCFNKEFPTIIHLILYNHTTN